MKNALSGYRVLDITDDKGMPCCRLLAGMGAEVIRVEPPSPEGAVAPADDAWYCYNNTGKSRISLDLARPEAAPLFERLVMKSDVLVESFSPGHLDSLGLGYDRLCQVNPALIMASITDFGQTGPYRDFRACNLVTSALGGQVYVGGGPQTSPLKPAGEQAYDAACLFAATGIMLAIWRRHTTGRGQHLDISAMECAASMLDQVLVRYCNDGTVSQRQGSSHWNHAFRVFKCRDGDILLSLFQNWDTLVELLSAEGTADDLADPKWRDVEARLVGAEHIEQVLEHWTRRHSVSELVGLGQLMHFPWAPVNSPEEVLKSEQLTARSFFTGIACAASGKTRLTPRLPIANQDDGVAARLHGPGEDNTSVYRDVLGLSETEINIFQEKGVI